MLRTTKFGTHAVLFRNRLSQIQRNYHKYPTKISKKYFSVLSPKAMDWIYNQNNILIKKEQKFKEKKIARMLSFTSWDHKINQNLNNLENVSYSLLVKKILLLGLIGSLCTLTLNHAKLEGNPITKTEELQSKETMENENSNLREKNEFEKQKEIAEEIVLQRKEFVQRKHKILEREKKLLEKKNLLESEKQELIVSKQKIEAQRELVFQKVYALETKSGMPEFVPNNEPLSLNEEVAQCLRISKLSSKSKIAAEKEVTELISANNTIQVLEQQLQYVVMKYESQIDKLVQKVYSLDKEYKKIFQKRLREQTIKLKQTHHEQYEDEKMDIQKKYENITNNSISEAIEKCSKQISKNSNQEKEDILLRRLQLQSSHKSEIALLKKDFHDQKYQICKNIEATKTELKNQISSENKKFKNKVAECKIQFEKLMESAKLHSAYEKEYQQIKKIF